MPKFFVCLQLLLIKAVTQYASVCAAATASTENLTDASNQILLVLTNGRYYLTRVIPLKKKRFGSGAVPRVANSLIEAGIFRCHI
jgi:hypothetical protein